MAFKRDNLESENFQSLRSDPYNAESNKKWTLALVLCSLSISCASFQFGYNISSLNSPSDIIKEFIFNETFLFKEYHEKLNLFNLNEGYIKGNETKLKNAKEEYELKKSEYLEALLTFDFEKKAQLDKNKMEREKEIREKFNMSIDEYFQYATNKLADSKLKLDSYRPKLEEGKQKVVKFTDILWTILNCLFVIGGMIGAFTSKFVLDHLGRKKGILFHNLFSLTGSILVFISVYLKYPTFILISRFLFGLQGGMSCSLVPTYLAEISPASLRGQIGVIHQLFITIGILFAQTLGFKQILGNQFLWNYLLAGPFVPALIGSLTLLIFFPESPKALLLRNNDYDAALKALILLRNTTSVKQELQEMQSEMNDNSGSQSKSVSIIGLFCQKELRWPLITSLVLQVTQQLCGVNAIFFYSAAIFKDAGIVDMYIQYAIFATGAVNVLATIICVPLIDRFGRRPLLLFPKVVMILNYIVLTVCLTFKDKSPILSYMCIVCIIIFVVCFAVGLGPIPFIYAAECFRQNARSSAMALCTLINWLSSFILTLTFPLLQPIIQQYVFLIFTGIVFVSFLIILKKVPETKGKTVDEIIAKFQD